VIALIPLSRFKITYRVATARPYSKFEHLVLRAVAEGAIDLRSLQDIFRIHPRLVVEALVTLIQAGWVAIGGSGRPTFMLSSDGRRALESGEAPESLVVFTPPPSVIVMERLTGALVPNSEIRFWSRRDLDTVWSRSLRLIPGISDTALDQGQVQHLIPRRRDEWLRWVGPIELIGQGAHWLPVDVFPDKGRINGLPESWRSRLSELILSEATHNVAEMDEDTAGEEWYKAPIEVSRESEEDQEARPILDAPKRPTGEFFISIAPQDFLYGSAHSEYARSALARARSTVLIASAFLRAESVRSLEAELLAALSRGVRVDFLWGYLPADNSDQKEALDWLHKLAYVGKQNSLPGRIWFNAAPSDSHMKVLIFDTDQGMYEGCVGSFNWLSSTKAGEQAGTAGDTIEVSLRLHDPSLLASLVRCVAGVCARLPTERVSSTSDRWMTIASDLEKRGLDAQDLPMRERDVNAKARIILDREHETLLREWSRSAQTQLLIMSHQLGIIANTRLAALASDGRTPGFECLVAYGYTEVSHEDVESIASRVRAAHGQLLHLPNLHAKLIADDRSLCVTSYNFLSADPFGKSTGSRELGIVIEGAPAAIARNELHMLLRDPRV
jgi:hypothetical protein